MKTTTMFNDLSTKFYVYAKHAWPILILGFVTSLLLTNQSYAAGTNYLSGLKADVGSTFGAGSDTQYFIRNRSDPTPRMKNYKKKLDRFYWG